MVSLTQLRKQIATERDKEKKLREREALQFEKIKLKKELKALRRTPEQKRNIELLKRTGRGLKILGSKARAFTIKQAERIRKQQLRDASMIRKRVKKRGKKLRKASRQTIRITIGNNKIGTKKKRKKIKKVKRDTVGSSFFDF
jgi:hypothetical protein